MACGACSEMHQFLLRSRNVTTRTSGCLTVFSYFSLELSWQGTSDFLEFEQPLFLQFEGIFGCGYVFACLTKFQYAKSYSSARNCIWLGKRCDKLFLKNRATHGKLCRVFRSSIVVHAYKKSRNKVREDRNQSPTERSPVENITLDGCNELEETSLVEDQKTSDITKDALENQSDLSFPPRDAVLKACLATSALLLTAGLILRQVSHVAFTEGWFKADSSTEISFGFELWHLELILALVALVSACRYTLLKTWQDFAESSEAANKQVLSSLKPLDYVFVSFLPGISEELLFRGALMPLLGLNWQSALVIGAFFGCLHLGNGRKYSFAIWATVVGFVYGLAAVTSSSIIVPMAAHSLNNLVGGILWRQESKSRAG